MAAAIVISLISWYFRKRRRTGDVHFSALFQIALSESKRRKCLNLLNMSTGGTLSYESKRRDIFRRITRVWPKIANCRVFSHLYMY